MQTLSTFTGWDFLSTWEYNSGAYPSLGLGGIGTLPVTWLYFSATRENAGVLLKWATGAEVNTKDFIAEKSADGTNWQAIGSVNATGNSTSIQEYSYMDVTPLAGINYYRINQRDIDGHHEFSKVIKINSGDAALKFSLSPNPAVNHKTVITLKKDAVVSIYNNTGILVNSLSLKEGRRELNFTTLPAGVYTIKVDNEKGILLLNR